MPASVSTNPTNGWDLVYAVRFSDVNAAIAAAWNAAGSTLPAAFSQQVDVSGTAQSVTGSFEPWQLALPAKSETIGSSDANAVMLLPLRGLSFTQAGNMPVAIDARVQVTLGFTAAGGTRQDLKTNAGATTFQLLGLSVPGGVPLDFLAKAIFEPALKAWLAQHLVEFDHVFHTVDFAGKLAGDAQAANLALAWLQPTTVGYGLHQPPVGTATLENSIFGVMAMTENRAMLSMNNAVDPYAIPANARASMLISAPRFLEKFVRPALPSLFKQAKPEQFDFDNDGNLSNLSDVSFGPMTITNPDGSDGKQVDPDIRAHGFSLGINGTEMALQFQDFHWVWSSGIDVYTTYKSYAELGLTASGAFTWVKDRSDPPTGKITKSRAVENLEIIEPIAFAVAGALLEMGSAAIAAKAMACCTTAAVEGGEEIAMSQLGRVGGALADDGSLQAAAQDAADAVGADALDVEPPQPATPSSTPETSIVSEPSTPEPSSAARPAEPAGGDAALPLPRPTKICGMLPRTWVGILSVMAAGGGVALGLRKDIMDNLANRDNEKIPKLQSLLDQVSRSMQWPNADQPLITSAELSSCLKIGINPNFHV